MNIILRYGIAVCCLLGAGGTACADDFLKGFLDDATADLHRFRDEALAERDAFRDSVMQQMALWVSSPWEPRPLEPPVTPLHKDPPVPPVVLDDNTPSPTPENIPVRDNPVVAPPPAPPAPRPEPVLPPQPEADRPEYFTFESFGTSYTVDAPVSLRMAISAGMKGDPSAAVRHYMNHVDRDAFARLSSSMQREAARHNLSSWGYHKLTGHFVQSFVPADPDLRNIIRGMLLTAAGFDVRFGGSRANGRIYLLTGCRELIMNEAYYLLDGNKRFYPFEAQPPKIEISPEKFGGTQIISCQPSGKERFATRPGAPHKVLICTHEPHCYENRCVTPVLTLSLVGNLNRMDFLSECPLYLTPGQEYSKWNTYASTAISDELTQQLYPKLKSLINGKSKLEAVNILMKFVEAFDYKTDSEMWGVEDRAFFPEETLHYPFRDCEDGAILLTRLVRDLVGLPAGLIYYPGHLAAAVAFDTPVDGAYINHNGRCYTVCDPTYYYVGVGVQMPHPDIDHSKAVLIPL